MSGQALVTDRASLAALRGATDLDEVIVRTQRLKYRGLMPCALKYGVWALRQGGRLIVQDEGLHDAAAPPFEVPFNTVRQWVMKFCARDARVTKFDASGSIELERTSSILPPGWSAGVVYSGREAEIPALLNCLRGLVRQPELLREKGGEIVVCGPPCDTSFLTPFPGVRYLFHSDVPNARLLICAKKNALIRELRGPRVVILHLRVVLEGGALNAVPREFDISSPNTEIIAGQRRLPYLSLGQRDGVELGRMPRGRMNMRNVADGDPLRLHERGGLYVDGGAFFVTKTVHADCPLDEAVAWEEGEDVEWCSRAFAHGYLIDLAPGSRAHSQTSKLRPLPNLGRLTAPAYSTLMSLRWLKAAGRHRWLTLLGRR